MSRSGSESNAKPASIDVENLSLVVPYYAQPEEAPASSWLATLFGAATAVPQRRFATLLDDISFSIMPGERVALIGRNGAGKSTLLRMLAGAFQPTSGRISVSGSRQALLSVGLGFNKEATVQENIYLRASAMNIPARDIRGMVEPVLDFSGLKEVANRRLFTLSSGQRMRLGFAISTMIQHDILLLDEWLGTGDAQFVLRARERMMDRVNGSSIVVIASHKRALLQSMCTRGILVDGGRIVFDGPVDQAFVEYGRLYPADPRAVRAAKKKKLKLMKLAEDRVRKDLEPALRKELTAKLKKKLRAKIRAQVEEEFAKRTSEGPCAVGEADRADEVR